MSLHDTIDATLPGLEHAFWSATRIVAEQCAITVDDAARHMLRRWSGHLKDFRIHHAIDYADDGRAAAWRVRLVIWRTDEADRAVDRIADSDPQASLDSFEIGPGKTVIYGLPAVATWALELITSCHAPHPPAGLSPASLANKLKSLRVALSNSGGNSVWRLRYAVTAQANRTRHFCAYVYVRREAPAHRVATPLSA